MSLLNTNIPCGPHSPAAQYPARDSRSLQTGQSGHPMNMDTATLACKAAVGEGRMCWNGGPGHSEMADSAVRLLREMCPAQQTTQLKQEAGWVPGRNGDDEGTSRNIFVVGTAIEGSSQPRAQIGICTKPCFCPREPTSSGSLNSNKDADRRDR